MTPLTLILDRLSSNLKKTGITISRQRLTEALAFATGLRNSNILVKKLTKTDIGQQTATYQRMLSNTQVALFDPIADLEFSADVDWALRELRTARTPIIMSPYGNLLRIPKISGPDVEFGTLNIQYSTTLLTPIIAEELKLRRLSIDPHTLSQIASTMLSKLADNLLRRDQIIDMANSLIDGEIENITFESIMDEAIEEAATKTFQIATPDGNLIDPTDLPNYYPDNLKNLTTSDLLTENAVNQTRTILAKHDFEFILRPVNQDDVEHPTIITQI